MIERIEKKIRAIIAEISELDEEEIRPESNFYEDLEIDSIKAIEIAVALEKTFGISVRDEDVSNVQTVKQSVELVKNSLAQASA